MNLDSVAMNLARDAQKAGARVGLTSDRITINGGKPLVGRIDVRGAKNLATKAMVAALLGDSPSRLQNVPETSDPHVATRTLDAYGGAVSQPADGELPPDPATA